MFVKAVFFSLKRHHHYREIIKDGRLKLLERIPSIIWTIDRMHTTV